MALHFYTFVSVMKDHLSHKTTLCSPVGWSLITGFTVIHYMWCLLVYYTCNSYICQSYMCSMHIIHISHIIQAYILYIYRGCFFPPTHHLKHHIMYYRCDTWCDRSGHVNKYVFNISAAFSTCLWRQTLELR